MTDAASLVNHFTLPRERDRGRWLEQVHAGDARDLMFGVDADDTRAWRGS